MSERIIVQWFRLDLRLSDLPSLSAAAGSDARVLPLFILDESVGGEWAAGGASRWWLHHSLTRLADDIAAAGGKLMLRSGDTLDTLLSICREAGADAVHCTRRYEPWAAAEENTLHKELGDEGITFKRFPGHLLHEPGTVLTQGGDPFKVFTPFWRACRRLSVAAPLPAIDGAKKARWAAPTSSEALDDWQLTPSRPNWAKGWETQWSPGEGGARSALNAFLDGPVAEYSEGRNLPAEDYTSLLSPHLHHGEISPRQVWAACEQKINEQPDWEEALRKFQAEVGWREFSYHLLHFFPHIPEQPFKKQFAAFPWQPDGERLRAWQQGQTGYPIVDAGMRELWQTGYMHNRVRMVVASFLCKHLLQHWRKGEEWFWDTLLDADLASNSCSWQWVAGSGADASPYFRIFNPVMQGEKFDKAGNYVRRWVPELAQMPEKFIHKPWEAPDEVLEAAGVKLGEDYPAPLVDHKDARQMALDAYAAIKQAS